MKLQTKRGNLSAYALSCGYVERIEDGCIVIQLSHEHGIYHVKKKVIEGKWQEWQSFDTLAQARKALSKIKREG